MALSTLASREFARFQMLATLDCRRTSIGILEGMPPGLHGRQQLFRAIYSTTVSNGFHP